MSNRQIILITGVSGLVGSRVAQVLSCNFNVLTPSRDILDITKADQVSRYVRQNKPRVVIHAAAFTDATAAEKERGDPNGICWKVNVDGTKYLNETAKQIGAYHIFISTGSVFSGTRDNPGPFTEDDEPPSDASKLLWYGWTKRCAEKQVDGAIIRISHPVKKEGPGVEQDYIHKLLNLYHKGRLYALFTDQFFPITWIDDVARVIEMLIESPRRGVFHVASPDLVSPYELMQYAVSSRPGLEFTAMKDFLKKTELPRRFTQYCAIDSGKTEKKLGLHFKSWKETVDRVFPVTNSSRVSAPEVT